MSRNIIIPRTRIIPRTQMASRTAEAMERSIRERGVQAEQDAVLQQLAELAGNRRRPTQLTDLPPDEEFDTSRVWNRVNGPGPPISPGVVDLIGGVEEATDNIRNRGELRNEDRRPIEWGEIPPGAIGSGVDPRSDESVSSGLEFDGRFDLTYDLKVLIPQPEPGYNTAKITVVTACGISGEKTFIYQDVCVPTPPPPTDNNIYIDRDVVDAYEDCLSGINDLFCNPTEDFGDEYGSLDIEVDYSRISLSGDKILIGAEILPIYKIRGRGTYSFVISALEQYGDNLRRLKTLYRVGNSVSLREGETAEVFPENPPIVTEIYDKITISFTSYDTLNAPSRQINNVYEVRRDVLPTINPNPKILASDNDLSDSNKETYITISSVVDLNKNLSNIREFGLLEADPIRDRYGAFWILDRDRTKYFYVNRENNLPEIITSPLQEYPGLSGIDYMYYTEIFRSSPAVSYYTANWVIDICYDYLKPYTKKEFDKAERPFSSRILDVRTEYNFYFKEYEEVQKDFSSRRENLLPNMYYLLLKEQKLKTGRTEKKEDDILIDPDIDNLISLVPSELSETINSGARGLSRIEMTNPDAQTRGLQTSPAISSLRGPSSPAGNTGLQASPAISSLRGPSSPTLAGISNRPGFSLENNANTAATAIPEIKGDYYNYFIEKYKTSKIERDPSLIERSRNIVIPYSFLPKIEEFSNKNQLFPMFVDIKFDTDPNTFVTRRLKQEGLGDWFFLSCVNKFIDNSVREQTFLKQQEDGQYFGQTNRYIEITSIINVFAKPEDKFVFLGDYKDYQRIEPSGDNLVAEKEAFVESIRQLVKQRGRTYAEILAGKKCYKEAVLYRIAKFGADKTTPIQNIWIPNDPDKNYLRYIDTQVVYEKGYTYRIYSYDLTIANEYEIWTPGGGPDILSSGGSVPPSGPDVLGPADVLEPAPTGPDVLEPVPTDTTEEVSRDRADFNPADITGLFNPPINRPPHVPEREDLKTLLDNFSPGVTLPPSSVQELSENISLDVSSTQLSNQLSNQLSSNVKKLKIKKNFSTR